MFRKPHTRIFGIALRKLGLQPHAVWYCGDHAHFDVHGATESGMFPVWYTGCHHRTDVRIPGWSGVAPADPCLEMEAWPDMIHLLDSLG
jgi:putative hydrolase of the HAD superfamily